MDKNLQLHRLLTPKTIAVFGGRAAAEVINQCQAIGFDGDIWPVNPGRDEIHGLRCFDSVDQLPGAPDASFIGVGPAATIDILRDLNSVGAGGAVCHAAGFAELGDTGKSLQLELLDAAGDVPFAGPNCHGFVNYLDGVALWPDAHGGRRVERGAAVILQSGNIAISLSMQQRSLPISYIITAGNQASLSLHDYMHALLDDERVSVIGLHIEAIDDVTAFAAAARRALQQKVPIVAIKTGTSALGAEATLSHTSSLAGSDDLYQALFARLGIARVESLHEFLETMKFLSVIGPLAGNRIGSMSCSGGDASMLADRAEKLGLQMPALSADSSEKLRTVLGDNVHVSNPLDYHTYIWGNEVALTESFTAMLENGFDSTLLVLDYPQPGSSTIDAWTATENALIAAREQTGHNTVVVSSIAENLPATARERMLRHGIAPIQGVNECLAAIDAASKIGAAQGHADSVHLPAGASPADGEVETLSESESKQLLAKYGLQVPEGQQCHREDVVAAAHAVGLPVCLKTASPGIAHKSDAGGVALNLATLDELQAAVDAMSELGDRFLVERMAPAPLAELIVGIKCEPPFGPALVIGAGGVLVELIQDAVTLLLPASRDDIAGALASLKVSALIDGARGSTPGDRDAIIDAVAAVAAYASDNADSLVELDVNPLFVLPDGALAVDALIRRRLR